jgi:hypothetical protein
MGFIINAFSLHLKYQDLFMEIENSGLMGEVILFRDLKVFLPNLVLKSKRKGYMKVNKNYFQVQ